MGQDLSVIINKHIGQYQTRVGHRGQCFSVDLHGNPVVDVDKERLGTDVDAVGDREREVERLAFAVDIVPLVLL